jgi:eukaryotic translation initiation factor 2C
MYGVIEEESATTLNSVTALRSKLRNVGVNVGNYTPSLCILLNPANFDRDIDAALQKFVSQSTRRSLKLILAIIPYINLSIYNRIKFQCNVKLGLLNVCTLGTKFVKANNRYYSNVTLKFNLKLGG